MRRWVEGVEYRWTMWKDQELAAVRRDLAELAKRGIKVNFFFPKWQGTAYPLDFADPPPYRVGDFSGTVIDPASALPLEVLPYCRHLNDYEDRARELLSALSERYAIRTVAVTGSGAPIPFQTTYIIHGMSR